MLSGGAGRDSIRGEDGGDEIDGGPDGDHAWGGHDSDTIEGGDGDDFLWGEGGGDMLSGGEGDDHIDGGDEGDELEGEAGNDRLEGGEDESADTLEGGEGRDFLCGGPGGDTLSDSADSNVNELFGDSGDDSLTGTVYDRLEGGPDTDSINGISDNGAWGPGCTTSGPPGDPQASVNYAGMQASPPQFCIAWCPFRGRQGRRTFWGRSTPQRCGGCSLGPRSKFPRALRAFGI